MRYLFWALSASALMSPALASAQDAQQRIEWNKPAEPFRISENVYYVGTRGLAAYLVTSPRGHILIDGGLPESAPLIAASIRQLGFALTDVEYLLINHAHFDHSGGLAELKRLTGARLVAMAAEKTRSGGGTHSRSPRTSFLHPGTRRPYGQGWREIAARE